MTARLAILASGRGSNLQAILDAIASEQAARLLQPVHIDIEQGKPHAPRGRGQRQRPADAAAGPGDDRDAAREVPEAPAGNFFHCRLLLAVPGRQECAFQPLTEGIVERHAALQHTR